MQIREQIQELRRRCRNHNVVGDVAVVMVTAQELDRILDLAEKSLDQEPFDLSDDPKLREIVDEIIAGR